MYMEWMRICSGMSDMAVCGVNENMWVDEWHGCLWSG